MTRSLTTNPSDEARNKTKTALAKVVLPRVDKLSQRQMKLALDALEELVQLPPSKVNRALEKLDATELERDLIKKRQESSREVYIPVPIFFTFRTLLDPPLGFVDKHFAADFAPFDQRIASHFGVDEDAWVDIVLQVLAPRVFPPEGVASEMAHSTKWQWRTRGACRGRRV